MAPRSTIRDKQTAEWIVDIIPRLSAGLNTSKPPELIEDEETPNSENLTFRDGRVRVDTGYRHFGSYVQDVLGRGAAGSTILIMNAPDLTGLGFKIGDIVYIQLVGGITWEEATITALTNQAGFELMTVDGTITTSVSSVVYRGHILASPPKGLFQHQTAGSSITPLMVTDDTVYKHVAAVDSWHLVSNGTDTTLNANGDSLDIQITVVSSTGFTAGQRIGINLDSGEQWQTTIDTVDSGTLITLDDALPQVDSDPVATSGNKVVEALSLLGDDENQVVWAAVPSNEWSVFTNGKDVPYKYDATLDTVEVIPNLGNVVCKTLSMIGEAFLVLGNLDEGAGFQPYKLRWSEGGDPTNWTTGISGTKELLDSRDHIVSLKQLATDMIVYRSHSSVQMRFIGQPNATFSFRPLIFGLSVGAEGFGPNSPNCVFQLSDRHIVFDRKAVYTYQGGVTVENIFENVFANVLGVEGIVDDTKLHRAFVQYVEKTDEVFICFADTFATFPNHAVIIDLKTNKWRMRKFTDEMTTAIIVTDAASLRIEDLIGDIQDQAWIIGSGPGAAAAPIVLFGSTSEGQVIGGGAGRAYAYDYITPTDDGDDIPWHIYTKRFRRYDRGMRVDFNELEHQGPEMTISRSGDGGINFILVGMVPVSLAPVFTRIYEQTVQESFLWKISGTGAAAEIGSFTFKHREEARWSL